MKLLKSVCQFVIQHNLNISLFLSSFLTSLFFLSNIKTLKFISYYIKAKGNDWIAILRWRERHLTTTTVHESILEPGDLRLSSLYNNAGASIDTSMEALLGTNISVVHRIWS